MSTNSNHSRSQKVSAKNITLLCYPQCIHAYHIWSVLFSQLNEKQQNYHLHLTAKQKIDVPLLTTDRSNHYFFSSHFRWIYAFYNLNKTDIKFRAHEKNNSYEFIIQALNEVKVLLCSGLHHSIKGLDIIAHWLNEQYLASHLHVVFGYKILTIEYLRSLSGLSKLQSPTSLISRHHAQLSLNDILAGIKS